MALDCLAKAALVIINICFVLVGLVLFIIGMILRFGLSVIKPLLPIDLDGFLSNLPSITGGVGLEGVTTSTTTDTIDVVGILNTIAVVLIVLGLFMLILGSTGCCGACCTVRSMLIAYVVITLVVFLVEFIIIGLLYSGVFSEKLKNKLNSTITDTYAGIEDFSLEGLAWNVIMVSLQCCGLDDYKDFNYASKWANVRSFTFNGYTTQLTMVTPVACCKTTGSFPSITPLDSQCTITPADNISNWNTGCWNDIISQIKTQETTFIGLFCCILIFEVVVILLAIFILMRKKGQFNVA